MTGTTTTIARADELAGDGIKPVVFDIGEVERLRELVVAHDVVYLTIGVGRKRGNDRGNDGDIYRNTYLVGARNLVSALAGSAVRQVVYTSSTGVYAQDDGEWVDESSPTEPPTENGQILVETERLLLAESPCTTTIFRLGGIYGPGRDAAGFVCRAAGTQRCDGDTYVNMIHVDDIVSAMTSVLDRPYHGVLNLTDDQPLRRREWYDRILAAHGQRPIDWEQSSVPSGQGKRVSNRLVKQKIGLELQHPMH